MGFFGATRKYNNSSHFVHHAPTGFEAKLLQEYTYTYYTDISARPLHLRATALTHKVAASFDATLSMSRRAS